MLSGPSLVLTGAGLGPIWQPRIMDHWEEKPEGAKHGVREDLSHLDMCTGCQNWCRQNPFVYLLEAREGGLGGWQPTR